MTDQQYPVKLYIYDLSHGMARNLSVALTGRLIEAIYHTSIVYQHSEIFYGQGISITAPGGSHHGQPMQIFDLGMTSIDQETLDALLDSLREKYTAQAYHLLDFNCNNFTEELSQILTGNSIPGHISSLPADFLSTPFGQMLRPQIDSMFRPSSTPASSSIANRPSSIGILNQVASQAFSNPASSSQSAVRTISSNSQIDALLQESPSVAILYTSETCPPCKIVQPVFSELAEKYSTSGKKILFARVDSSPSTSLILSSRGITATPTVQVWTKGSVKEVKGADIGEIRTQIELSLFELYPPHPHSRLSALKSVSLVPRKPILISTVPNFRTLLIKLDTFISSAPTSNFNDKADLQESRKVISSVVIPALEKRFNANSSASSLSSSDLDKFSKAIETFLKLLPIASLFPLLDLIRISILDDTTAKQISSLKLGDQSLLPAIIAHINKSNQDGTSISSFKATMITTLKLLANVFASPSLRSNFLGSGVATADSTALVVAGLLVEDKAVRSAAATSAYNAALHAGEGRKDWLDQHQVNQGGIEPEWEAELASALVEALKQETESDETIHRLSASLFLLLHLSPAWLEHLSPLLEVLEAPEVLKDCSKRDVVTASSKSKDLKILLDDCQSLCSAVA